MFKLIIILVIVTIIYVATHKPITEQRRREMFSNSIERYVKLRVFPAGGERHPELGYGTYYLSDTNDPHKWLSDNRQMKLLVERRKDGFIIIRRSNDNAMATFTMTRDGYWVPRGWITSDVKPMHVYGLPVTRMLESEDEIYFSFEGMLPSEGLINGL
jgi:hypothetical protein